MARKAFTEHPEFIKASAAANLGLREAAEFLSLTEADLPEEHANRIVDDLTKLLLRAYDAKQAKAA